MQSRTFSLLTVALLAGATSLGLGACATASAEAAPARPQRNVIVFVADGLRRGSVNATDTPALYSVRANGVDFANSHALFPTFTTPNASAIATGHYLGDSGDFSNTVYVGYPIFNDIGAPGTLTPFLESNQVLADVDEHVLGGNYLNEETLLALARDHGYATASIGKVGPVGIQDVTQLKIDGAKTVQPTTTVFIDDLTGTAVSGVPLSPTIQAALTGAGLALKTTARNQPAGNVTTPGTLNSNAQQQQYFADAATKAVLPTFVASGQPFALVYWSRDPDGTQHNQGDSLNSLSPGINGPTSTAGVQDADRNLQQILDYLQSHPDVAANTDVFVTADHGFATISKHEIDAAGHASAAYATKFRYLGATGTAEVLPGWLPPGFLAIDIAHELSLPLFDPDSQVVVNGTKQYEPVDPTIAVSTATVRQRPASGNGLIGGSGAILDRTDAQVVVAANGGSDLIYVPGHDANLVRRVVAFLARQDYVGGLFVDSTYGDIPGALPLSAIDLEGDAVTPRPAIAVNFRTFSLDPANPLQTAVQIADTTLQEGQGMHGSLGRDNTYNNMAAIGPDFRHGFVDDAPVGNADIARTLAHVLGLPLPSNGDLRGRVLREALVGGHRAPGFERHRRVSAEAPGTDHATVLEYQTVEGRRYFDVACFAAVPHRDHDDTHRCP
jgi:arylsulfatase A-like enzyme